jgi:predicted small lipoprotein YifL
MPRRLLSAAAACTLLLGLAACGEGSDGPVTTPPPEIDISAPSDGGGGADPSDGGGDEADPSAAPDVPAPDPADYPGMDENTEEGAMQSLRYYVAVSMWAHQTGEDSTLKALEESDCEGCPGFNAELSDLQKLGKYWSHFTVTDVGITPHESKNFQYEVVYSFTVPEHTRPNENTGEAEEYDPVEYIVAAGMDWTSQGWKVGGLKGEWGPDVHDSTAG